MIFSCDPRDVKWTSTFYWFQRVNDSFRKYNGSNIDKNLPDQISFGAMNDHTWPFISLKTEVIHAEWHRCPIKLTFLHEWRRHEYLRNERLKSSNGTILNPILHHRGITWQIFTWENLYSTYTTAKKYKRWTKYIIITTPKCETLQPWANASQGYANQSNAWQFVPFLKEIEATVAMDMAWGMMI